MQDDNNSTEEVDEDAVMDGYVSLTEAIFNSPGRKKTFYPKPDKLIKTKGKVRRKDYYHWYYENIIKKDPDRYHRHLESCNAAEKRMRMKRKKL
jgi:hypothetical protein